MKLDDPGLSDPFVSLEPWADRHYDDLRLAANDPDLWTYTTFDASGDGFDPYWSFLTGEAKTRTVLPFAVIDASSGKIVGSTTFLSISEAHSRVEIGHTWYRREAHGSAINPACKRLMIGRAFDWGAKRVELKTDARNHRSRAAMRKMGATEEGILRSHMTLSDGTRRDTVYYSILFEEWDSVKFGLDQRLAAFRN